MMADRRPSPRRPMDSLGPYPLDSIHCGDCVLLMRALPEACIDLTVTSPPYDNLRTYNGYVFDFESIARQLYRVTKPGGVVVWVVGDATVDGSESLTSFKQAIYFVDGCGFNLHDTMIYHVMGTGAKGSRLSYWQAFEFMFVFSKGRPNVINLLRDKKNLRAGVLCTTGGKQRATGTRQHPDKGTVVSGFGIRENVWQVHAGNNGDDPTIHPAVFPEGLAADHIVSWSNPGDVVLDPMCGSGTTLKMARTLERRYLGFDISDEYCELARRRLAGVSIPMALFGEEETVTESKDGACGHPRSAIVQPGDHRTAYCVECEKGGN